MRMLVNSVHARTYFLLKCTIQVYESFLNCLENNYRFRCATTISCYFFSILSPKEWKKYWKSWKMGEVHSSFKMFLNNSIRVKILFCQNQSDQTKISKNLEVPKPFENNGSLRSYHIFHWNSRLGSPGCWEVSSCSFVTTSQPQSTPGWRISMHIPTIAVISPASPLCAITVQFFQLFQVS